MAGEINPIHVSTTITQPVNDPQAAANRKPETKQTQSETVQVRYDVLSPIYARKNDIETAKQIVGERELKKMGAIECETCANRTYQDQSPDPGVSMKAPTKLTPNVAAGAVRSHENEHVTRNKIQADQQDREIVYSSVQIFNSVCPECGRVYVSGGKTTTITSGKTKQAVVAGLLDGLKLDQDS